MDPNQLEFIRLLFQRKVLFADGQEYQDLFSDVMEQAHPDFVRMKTQGALGDRKNDGYCQRAGRYFQVFAPEDPQASVITAAEKIDEDFAGLKAYWNDITKIKEWHFVFNDKYRGTYPTIEKQLESLRRKHRLDSCTFFRARHLEEIVLSMPDGRMKHIPSAGQPEINPRQVWTGTK